MDPTDTKSKEKKRSQWRLSTLLILMLGFGLLFGGIASLRGNVAMEVDFSSLPTSDDALRDWLSEKHNASKITIDRRGEKAIAIEFLRPILSLDIPVPPWDKLGYGTLGSFTFAQSTSIGWWIPIGLFIVVCAGWISNKLHQLAGRLSRLSQAQPIAPAVQAE